jgi:hypothetical protein
VGDVGGDAGESEAAGESLTLRPTTTDTENEADELGNREYGKSPPFNFQRRKFSDGEPSAGRGAASLGAEADSEELGLGGLALPQFDALENGPRGVGHLRLLVNRGGACGRFSIHTSLV